MIGFLLTDLSFKAVTQPIAEHGAVCDTEERRASTFLLPSGREQPSLFASMTSISLLHELTKAVSVLGVI